MVIWNYEAGDGPQPLKSFVEKPDRATAEEYLAAGRYYWNSGMFCFAAGVMAEEYGITCARCMGGVKGAFAKATQDELGDPL